MKINLTKHGIDMLLQSMTGGSAVTFSDIVIGNGENAGDEAEDLSNPLVYIPIKEYVREEGAEFVTISGSFDNSKIESRFWATEIGVRIVDPYDDENRILFAYGYVPEDEAAVIPSVSDYAFETIEKCMVFVGTAENVDAVISGGISTVSKKEFEEHTGNTNNPHNVTKKQLGLENVPNVATDDQKPTIEYEELSYTGKASDFDELDIESLDPKSGESLRALLKKICSVVKESVRHMSSRDNPHETTASQAGSSSSTHTHSTSQINSGTFSIKRGGTGASTVEGARKNLEINNVPNVTTDNQTPTIKYEDLSYTGKASDLDSVTEDALCPSDGNKLKDIMSKICSIVKMAFYHIKNSSNPHNVSCSQIGAASENHKHYAAGFYGGDGTKKRKISLDFTPSAVLVLAYGNFLDSMSFADPSLEDMYNRTMAPGRGGMAVTGINVTSERPYGITDWDEVYTAIMVCEKGFFVNFSVNGNGDIEAGTNVTGVTYHYIAFG